jgi:hypothetical protein
MNAEERSPSRLVQPPYAKLVDVRLPDEFRKTVVFLGLRSRDGRTDFKGTGFLVGMRSAANPNASFVYLITARHCVRRAETSPGTLVVRVNTSDGASRLIEQPTEWHFPEDEGVDVAVHPFEWQDGDDHVLIPFENLATLNRISEYDLGIGDEVGIVGLFHSRSGRQRNLPVVRSAIIASMPDEPFEDAETGLPFDAYIIEVRSFGGLSGSPVFFIEQRGLLANRPVRTYSPLIHQPVFIGLVRGHWDETTTRVRQDLWESETAKANLGLALVTPIAHALEVLTSEPLAKERRRFQAGNTAS